MDPKRFYGIAIPQDSDEDSDEEEERFVDDPDDEDYNPRGDSRERRNIIIYPSDSDSENTSDEDDPLAPGPSQSRPRTVSKKLNPFIWQEKSMQYDETAIAFLGDDIMPQEIKQLDTPLQYFLYFLRMKLWIT